MTLVLAAATALTALAEPNPPVWYVDDLGSEETPYEISNYTELKEFAAIVNGTGAHAGNANPDACAELKDDIEAKNDPNDTEYATDWTPIGNETDKYTGVFDGQGHTITGLSTPGDNEANYVGLFGYVDSDGEGNLISAESTVSEQALAEAAESGEPVTLPVQLEPADSAGDAPELTITLLATDGPVTVEIPVKDVKPGTVVVLVHEDGTEEVVKVFANSENGLVLKLDGSVTVKVVDNSKEYDDVSEDAWYVEAVEFVTSRELFVGTGQGFEPDTAMSRAMLVTVLWRLGGEETAGETDPDAPWYAAAEAWAESLGIVNGTENGFDPDAPVTREQIATMLYRFAGTLGLDTSASAPLDGFVDGDQTSEWAEDAMRWAVAVGLFQGDDTGALDPQVAASRAQVAALVERMVKLMVGLAKWFGEDSTKAVLAAF